MGGHWLKKVGIPNFEDFVTKASKLHTTLKTTIVVLGSFLDSFQKIADTATNTKDRTTSPHTISQCMRSKQCWAFVICGSDELSQKRTHAMFLGAARVGNQPAKRPMNHKEVALMLKE
ncbi:hypothetical protein TCAL_17234 [Tigriopus californicus]|uniref:IMD domain-containing protein n=1 Tax=Tigriopus californicus TaxID=6832 RepID=A0A553N6T8_TIGCA|nr:hypothetical protein TCAL_17234 [Tigriopus californicus]